MNQAPNKFYVYEHLKKDTKEIFYVGKGCRNRHSQKDNRNKFWHNIVNKHGFEVRFVAKELDEEFAFLVEEERIDQLKRLNVKLCNLTNGGEGSSGLVLSEEVKQLVSKRFKGKKLTEEHRKKCSDSLKKVKKTKEWVEKIAQKLRGKKRDPKDNVAAAKAVSKPVICIDTNERFESGRAAANKYEISATEISRACTGKALFAAGKKWRFE